MSKEFKPTEYILQSVNTSKQFNDAEWTLSAPDEKEHTLIRAVYTKKQIEVKDQSHGIYHFADWLPIGFLSF